MYLDGGTGGLQRDNGRNRLSPSQFTNKSNNNCQKVMRSMTFWEVLLQHIYDKSQIYQYTNHTQNITCHDGNRFGNDFQDFIKLIIQASI